MSQLALIPEAVPTSPRPHVPTRGRGATSRIEQTWEAPRPNPAGRRHLTIRFRPLKRHSEPYRLPSEPTSIGEVVCPPQRPIYEVAIDLLKEYFRAVGGFRVVDDERVAAWSDLLADYTPQEIRWAITAKALSLVGETDDETAIKRKFAGKAETFPERIDYWLEQSPDYQRRVALRSQLERSRQMDRLAAVRANARNDQRQATIERQQAEAAEREKRLADHEAYLDRYWDSLSSAQRAKAIKAVRPMWEINQETLRLAADPDVQAQADSDEQQAVLRARAISWATFRWPPKGPDTGAQQ